jgi:quercetin dioxygenase-like cupin family protein
MWIPGAYATGKGPAVNRAQNKTGCPSRAPVSFCLMKRRKRPGECFPAGLVRHFRQGDYAMTKIIKSGSQPSSKGAAEYFTGHVRIDPLFQAAGPSRVSAALVTFEPGARSAWHRHPLGQHLVVTAGCGWVQCEGGPKREIRAGDVHACACGQKHWHGATDTTAMSHIAIQEALDGKAVDWLEKVTDAEYLAKAEE